jgi:hypothetical protein
MSVLSVRCRAANFSAAFDFLKQSRAGTERTGRFIAKPRQTHQRYAFSSLSARGSKLLACAAKAGAV